MRKVRQSGAMALCKKAVQEKGYFISKRYANAVRFWPLEKQAPYGEMCDATYKDSIVNHEEYMKKYDLGEQWSSAALHGLVHQSANDPDRLVIWVKFRQHKGAVPMMVFDDSCIGDMEIPE